MKALKIIAVVLVVVLALLAAMIVCLELKKDENPVEQPTEQTTETAVAGGALTWEEYQAMSLEEQDAYFQQFESAEAFEAWLDSVRPTETAETIPTWDPNAKRPDTYTWEEYQALSREEQEAFYQWFATVGAFEKWMNSVKPTEPTTPDATEDQPGQTAKPDSTGKKPSDYTWEEYQKMSPKEQDEFFKRFESVAAFEKWLNSVKPKETTPQTPVWNKPGKKPDEYTWAEYEALSREEQDAFYLWFASATEFEEWMNSAKPAETTPQAPEWNKPGKTPDEYTWEEYQALSQIEQEAFYQWFGSMNAFEAWMNSVKPAETTPQVPVWDKPGKAPNEYTWEEFLALSPMEQEAFYLWFDSVDAFDAWQDAAQ